MKLSDNVSVLSGVGPEVAKKLAILKIKTVEDLIFNYPRRYEDYSEIKTTAQIKPGDQITLKGEFKSVSGRYVRRGMHITEAVFSDEDGSIKVIWFNQPYRAGAIQKSKTYLVSGLFEFTGRQMQMTNPSAELESNFPVNTARIIPIYKETKGLKSAMIRRILSKVAGQINDLPEILPHEIIQTNKLVSRADALYGLHFPKSKSDLEQTKRRLSFEELFTLVLASLINKREFTEDSGVKIDFDEDLAKSFVAGLPYDLTDAQRKVIWQIYGDLQATTPMNRLVEGDVGSGKTVVATMSAIMALNAGFQVALMAPTEILASQHFETFKNLLAKTKFCDDLIYLSGSSTNMQKTEIKQQIKSGKKRLLIGTHALITEDVDIKNLGLVIIDEQHRFGVNQRKALQKKVNPEHRLTDEVGLVMPHVLSMTATPIPRSLALTVYGDLDISIIDQMPPGRKPVKTKIVSPNSKAQMYDEIRPLIASGQQAFVVCPLIEESGKLNVLSAEQVYKDLSTKVFKDLKVGLLHGKLKTDQKDEIMQKFIDKQYDILVSTTVIEVGVDVPNASIMIIEGAERFGLAQAHQLRGRVGRGGLQGYCYLVMSDSKPPTRRLRALEQTTDGFRLAELDLEIRGPGAIYGTMQSGEIDLRIADISDSRLISAVRSSAQKFIDDGYDLSKYPELKEIVNQNQAVTNLN